MKTLLTASMLCTMIGSASYAQTTTNHDKHGVVTPATGSEVDWHRFNTYPNGSTHYIDFGPANDIWAHIYTDVPKFILNKDVYSVTGGFGAYSTNDLTFKTYTGGDYTTKMTIKKDGRIGIGTQTPSYKLDVVNSTGTTAISARAVNGHIRLFETDQDPTHFTQIERNGGKFHMYQHNGSAYTHVLSADMSGNVSIGTSVAPTGYKLAVKGKVIAEAVKVKLYADWPDYVFDKDYDLMNISALEDFLEENSHLPNVPSEKEIKEEGIDLGEMDGILLRKIEELTLYVIELKNENERQQELIDGLMKK